MTTQLHSGIPREVKKPGPEEKALACEAKYQIQSYPGEVNVYLPISSFLMCKMKGWESIKIPLWL